MNKDRKNIPFTQIEKENSIDFILKEVDLQPVTFRAFIRSYFQEVGFRYLFWGLGDILFIVGLLLVGVVILYLPDLHQSLDNGHSDKIYFTVFMVSPLCYALLYFLGIWKERLLGTFELKMTLRVSLKELLILRMLAFSGIALVVSVGSNVLMWQLLGQELSLMRLFSLSFTSLFLFANIQLLLEYKVPLRCSYWVTPIVWGDRSILSLATRMDCSASSVCTVFNCNIDCFWITCFIYLLIASQLLYAKGRNNYLC